MDSVVINRLALIVVFFLLAIEGTRARMPKHGCKDKCRYITVPYPFGIERGCYLHEPFELTCNESFQPPSLHFVNGNKFGIEKIYTNKVAILNKVQPYCYNRSKGRPQTIGSTQYKLNHYVFAYLVDIGIQNYTGGCVSFCGNRNTIFGYSNNNNSSTACTGTGCCETSIPKPVSRFRTKVASLDMGNPSKQGCGIAFIAHNSFCQGNMFNASNGMANYIYDIPTVLNFEIGNMSCHEAQKSKSYVCGKNTKCADSSWGAGYTCPCLPDFINMIFFFSLSKDIDECKDPKKYHCHKGEICISTPGGYFCACPRGFGTSAAVVVTISADKWLCKVVHKRKKTATKEKIFKRNGGLPMEQLHFTNDGSATKIKLFSAEELEKATDNFNPSRVLGRGGHGTVYKGMLSDGSIAAVKKSHVVHENQVDRFINEVLILSQINHRNIEKLYGCCLESHVPLLVYEYVSNGTLSYHFHDAGLDKISWLTRLQIASEVAGALAYLHSCVSTAIFHRDIKPSNIPLDDNFGAVVSDFGLSRSILICKTHLTPSLRGTFDKSDVYALRLVLAEILTRKKVLSISDEGLVAHFRSSVKHNVLFQILDELVVREGQEQEILVVAKLAKRCLKLKANKRPSMKEVAAEPD
ncbi:Non-specific serine/threonine protein kinase, partial [Bertholletia excelsa]